MARSILKKSVAYSLHIVAPDKYVVIVISTLCCVPLRSILLPFFLCTGADVDHAKDWHRQRTEWTADLCLEESCRLKRTSRVAA